MIILEAYLATAALGLGSVTINNAILKNKLKKDGYTFKNISSREKIKSWAPLVFFGLTPIYNLIVFGAIATGSHDINKFMGERLLEKADKTVKHEEPVVEETITTTPITKLEDVKTPQDRISYVSYEYEKIKPHTLVRKR